MEPPAGYVLPTLKTFAPYLVGYSIAGLTTLLRLGHRYRRRQLWWDDGWALVCLLVMLLSMTTGIMELYAFKPDQTNRYNLSTNDFVAWSNFFIQPAVIWTSRLSILATIMRFSPPGPVARITRWSFIIMVVGLWIPSTISKIFYFGIPVPRHFPLGEVVQLTWPTILNLILNILSTAWLVGWPVYIISQMESLKPARRRLFLACFSTAAVLGAVNTWHGANLIRKLFKEIYISSHTESIVAVVTPNVLVLVAYVYRVVRTSNDAGSTSSDSSESTSTAKETNVVHQEANRSTMDIPTSSSRYTSSVGPFTTIYSSDYASSFSDSSQGYRSTQPQTESAPKAGTEQSRTRQTASNV